ncbi:MAG: hypothetical protein ACAI38_21535 [Myxococcota bacterium]
MAGAAPLTDVSPEVTSFLIRAAAMSSGNPDELTSQELDSQIASQNRIGLERLGAYAAAAKGQPAERDVLSAENHHRTANHLLGIRRALFGDGQGAMKTPDALSRASGFRLQWNQVPGEFPTRCSR